MWMSEKFERFYEILNQTDAESGKSVTKTILKLFDVEWELSKIVKNYQNMER